MIAQGTGWCFYPCPAENIFYLEFTDGYWDSVTEEMGLGSIELINEASLKEQYKKEAVLFMFILEKHKIYRTFTVCYIFFYASATHHLI